MEEKESIERFGMANRFRFVDGEGEKVVPEKGVQGDAADETMAEIDEAGLEGVGEGEGGQDGETGEGDAEAFLAGLQDEMTRGGDGFDEGVAFMREEPPGAEGAKRKRAEDLDGR